MYVSIVCPVPNPDDLLALEVEELGGVLLMHLNSFGRQGGNGVVNNGLISLHNLLNNLDHYLEYPGRQTEVNKALMEAWACRVRAFVYAMHISLLTGAFFRDVLSG
jgi:hypothetical protein